ncbi:MAG: 1-acyl-sn-glycerol-3-phosphate acyltransferase [Planctomycetaceae bacterium]|nr:1-acyl-sn-glycerol-3-phosphate acyltransferase [Planctomycetaceae bacterium]|tara:strand:- start:49 stop:696 length:648 start_codon:yes stop_codon:yes gene_type:complete
MDRSISSHLFYRLMQTLLLLGGVLFFRIRLRGILNEPEEGPVLVVSNHQSHLDPPMIGMFFRRPLNYMARETLFKFPPLGWLIRTLGAIPIDRDGVGLSGMKETLRRLKYGQMVLVFPEGSRTRDGQLGALKPGFCALARRGGVKLLPVGIAGAYRAWPRSRSAPGRATVQIRVGKPISPEEIAALDDKALIARVQADLQACWATAEADCWRSGG